MLYMYATFKDRNLFACIYSQMVPKEKFEKWLYVRAWFLRLFYGIFYFAIFSPWNLIQIYKSLKKPQFAFDNIAEKKQDDAL